MAKSFRIKLSIFAGLMLTVCIAAFSPAIYAAAPNLPGSGGGNANA